MFEAYLTVLSWEQYQQYYERTGRLINDIGSRNNPLTERGLRSRFDRYVRSNERKIEKQKSKDPPKTYGHFIKGRSCQFVEVLRQARPPTNLSDSDLGTLDDLLIRAGGFIYKVDPAHIFSRGAFPWMSEIAENIVPLNRYSHSMIDIWKHPVFGSPITDEQRDLFWRILIGDVRYEKLLLISKRKEL